MRTAAPIFPILKEADSHHGFLEDGQQRMMVENSGAVVPLLSGNGERQMDHPFRGVSYTDQADWDLQNVIHRLVTD